ncbi:response regulator [Halobacteriovorax sp. HLS]|uniref:response regulator n=1 Tax=Halobacteriovorax sp. HLS TaxID=2234000 RepID=UPI000FD9CCA6|nr:response regulator [Halobacteriovorax sp. HLS]
MNNEKRRVIIIDDEPDLLEICADAFEMEDYQVLTAADGKQGLDLITSNEIDVIISDSFMPEMTGLELLSHLKNSNTDYPLFYLSTGAIDITEEELKEKGATGLISKPFDLDEILERIKIDLETRKNES